LSAPADRATARSGGCPKLDSNRRLLGCVI
jgi:hypothetical protein